MSKFDDVIFKKKKFSDILEEIHKKNHEKDNKINILIDDLKPLVKTMNDASLVVPLIKEYLEIGVKNDELLVKMAAIIQRSVAKDSNDESGGTFGLSEEDIAAIENEMKDELSKKISKVSESVEKKIGEINEKSVSKNTEAK